MPNNIDDIFKKASEGFDVPTPDESQWKNISSTLTKEGFISTPISVPFYLTKSFIFSSAAILLTSVSLLIWSFSDDNTNSGLTADTVQIETDKQSNGSIDAKEFSQKTSSQKNDLNGNNNFNQNEASLNNDILNTGKNSIIPDDLDSNNNNNNNNNNNTTVTVTVTVKILVTGTIIAIKTVYIQIILKNLKVQTL